MDYPDIDNFNPGGDDATITNNITTAREQPISGEGPNGIRDKGYDEDDEGPEFPRWY
jgi:hypothetical protein